MDSLVLKREDDCFGDCYRVLRGNSVMYLIHELQYGGYCVLQATTTNKIPVEMQQTRFNSVEIALENLKTI